MVFYVRVVSKVMRICASHLCNILGVVVFDFEGCCMCCCEVWLFARWSHDKIYMFLQGEEIGSYSADN